MAYDRGLRNRTSARGGARIRHTCGARDRVDYFIISCNLFHSKNSQTMLLYGFTDATVLPSCAHKLFITVSSLT